MSLLDTLTRWTAVNDPWEPGYADRKAAATTELLAVVEAMADAGEHDANRLWEALVAEREYAARNAAAGDKMHRKVPEYGPAIYAELARLQADAHQVQRDEETAWCPTCRKRRVVEEASDESAYEGHHEVGYWVQRLMCGHQLQSEGRIIGSSPGGESAAEAIAGARTQARLARAAESQERFGL